MEAKARNNNIVQFIGIFQLIRALSLVSLEWRILPYGQLKFIAVFSR